MSPEGEQLFKDFVCELDKVKVKGLRNTLSGLTTPTGDTELSDNALLVLNGFVKSTCLADDEKVVSAFAVYKKSRFSVNKSSFLPKLLKVQESTDFVLGFRNCFMKNSNRGRNLLTDNALALWIEYKNKHLA